jgi:unsaturated rhamnogalacturonyl hydrolase
MMIRKIIYILALAMFFATGNTRAQQNCCSRQVSQTAMTLWKDGFSQDGKPSKWSYDQGVILEGIAAVWKQTADPAYFNYIQKSMDSYVGEDGQIQTYKQDDHNID